MMVRLFESPKAEEIAIDQWKIHVHKYKSQQHYVIALAFVKNVLKLITRHYFLIFF